MRFYDYITHYEEYLSTPFPWSTTGIDPDTSGRGIKFEIAKQLDMRLEKHGHKAKPSKTSELVTPRMPFSFPNNLYSLRPFMEADYPESLYTFYGLQLALLTNFSGQINERHGIEPPSQVGDITNLLKHLLLEHVELFGPDKELEGLSAEELAIRDQLGPGYRLIPIRTFKRWLWGYVFKVQAERLYLHESRPTFNVYPSMCRAILRSSPDSFFEKLTTDVIKEQFKKEKSYMLQFPKYTLSPKAVSYDISSKELWPKEKSEEAALLNPDDWLNVYTASILGEIQREQTDFEFTQGRTITFEQGVLGNILVACGTAISALPEFRGEAGKGEVVALQVAKYMDKDKPRWDSEMVYTDANGNQTDDVKQSLIASFDETGLGAEWLDKPFFTYPRGTFEFTDVPAEGQDILVISATLYDEGGFESFSSGKKTGPLNDKISFIESRVAKEVLIVLPLLEGQSIADYINTILDKQTRDEGRHLVKTLVYLALSNLFLVANRNENALPVDLRSKPTDDYQGHVNRAVAQNDLNKVTENNLLQLADKTSQEIYKNRLYREPQTWSGRDAGTTLLEIAKEDVRSDPKYVCDVCHKRKDPEEYDLITSAAMEKAVRSGFNPFELGIAKGSDDILKQAEVLSRSKPSQDFNKIAAQVFEDSRITWLNSRVSLDVSGWNLCKDCYNHVKPHLSAKDLRYPINPPTAAIQRLIGPTNRNLEVYTDSPTPPWRTLFPKEHLRPIQRVPEGIRHCNAGKNCYLEEKKWRRCCGEIFRKGTFRVINSSDPRDAGYLYFVAKGAKGGKVNLKLAPIPKLYNIGERLEYRLRSMQDKIMDLKRKALKKGVSFDDLLEEEYYRTDDPDKLSFLEEATSPVPGSMQIHWISQRRKWLEERGEKSPGSRKALQNKLNRLAREGADVPSEWPGSGSGCGYAWGGFKCPDWQEQANEVCDHLPELRFVSPHTIKTSKKRIPTRAKAARAKAEKRKRVKRAAKKVTGEKGKRKRIIRPPEPLAPEEVGGLEPETVEAWGLIGQLLSDLPGWDAKHAADVLSGKLTPEQLVEVRKGLSRDTKMVKRLKAEYSDTCQVCGLRLVDENDKGYSEGSHIIPFEAVKAAERPDLDVRSNILILCPNHHTEFDLGAFTLMPVETDYVDVVEGTKTTIEIPKTRIDYMVEHLDPNNPYHGTQLTVLEGHGINPYFVAHRRERFEDLVQLLQGRLSRYGVGVYKPWNINRNPDVPSKWEEALAGSPLFEGVRKKCRLCGHSFPISVDEAESDLICICECCRSQDYHCFNGGFCEGCFALS